jgi:heme-degrading monooxygenase HmoA
MVYDEEDKDWNRKEVLMAVKVLIKRHIKEGKGKEVFALLNKTRAIAMNQKGYITGETLMSHHDPHRVIVISTWQTIENWLAWKDNKDRMANEAKLEQYLEFPTEYEEYVFGTFPYK